MTQHSKTREFCGCETYAEDYESGMVVCWKCEQIVSHVDDEGAITTAWMQAEIKRMREALEEIYRQPCGHPDDPDETAKLIASYAYVQNVAYHALNGMAPPKDWEPAPIGEPAADDHLHECKCELRPGRCNC